MKESRIQGAIFDMDGLLVDSEPLWAQAEMEVFGKVGFPLTFQQTRETHGIVIEDVAALRFSQRPWKGPSPAEVAEAITDRLIELVLSQAHPMPGASEALSFVRRMGCRVGLATSSHPRIVDAVLHATGLAPAFDHVQSAFGLVDTKPHPAVYLEAARALDLAPSRCVAFEDSIPGLISARAARMRLIAVPDAEALGDPRFSIADVILPSLLELDDAVWTKLYPPRLSLTGS